MAYFELFNKIQITLIQESFNGLKDKFQSVEALKKCWRQKIQN